MSDLEGLANRLMDKKYPLLEVKARLEEELLTFKTLRKDVAEKIADAVIEEVSRSRQKKMKLLSRLLSYPKAYVSMGEMGVGSRGEGDLFIHKLVAKLASAKTPTPVLGPLSLDDAGVVAYKDMLVSVAVDGTHSRLSNYPFLAGFHVTRACLRDVYVKGAKPIALFDDVHLADDGDVGKLFDFVAGINTVASLMRIPIIAGSTLRIGGDMVIGERMVSCVGAVGILASNRNLTARRNIRPNDVILMTEGAGGGTIATAAIYSGSFEAIIETLNVKFLNVCKYLIE
ncbi:MAG: AIR synthase related protein, partial [Candidatus Bathyarchaeia archaeon]